jgi:poly(3-hydroxybutyrate) depolymerase
MPDVGETRMVRRPFASLVRLRREGGSEGPRILLVTPMSGHRPALLHDLAMGLLPYAEVYFVAWKDASNVPAAEGPFGLAENIDYVAEFIRWLGPDIHVVGLSQSPLPVLAATALLAEGYGAVAEPASITLISGFLDPRIHPTRVGMLWSSLSAEWFDRWALTTVDGTRPGAGRRIYPASIQSFALGMYLRRHLATMGELWFKAVRDDGDPAGPPFLASYFSVMDLPGELVADIVKYVFHDHALACGQLCYGGRLVHPAAISRSGLMTIEGGRDDISGIGQTAVAHHLCRSVPDGGRCHHLEPDIGHFGAFHGRAWRERILPRVVAFIRACERRAAKGRVINLPS